MTTGSILLYAAVAALASAIFVSLRNLWRGSAPRPLPQPAPPPQRTAKVAPVAAIRKPIAVPQVPQFADEAADWDVTQIQVLALLTTPEQSPLSSAKLSAFAHQADDLDSPEQSSRVLVTYEEGAEEEEATSPHARFLICAQGDSDTGHKRRQNEDSFLFMTEHSLFAVADGMGGQAGGSVASTLAVETLRDVFERGTFEATLLSDKPVPQRGRELACAMWSANHAVFKAAKADPELSNMGTTAVVARFSPNKQKLYLAHVGDSRCYRLRAAELRQLTTDHTMSLFGMSGPRAKDLCRAVGVQPEVDIDLIVDKPQGDDIYLLCSDGLPKMVADDQIRDLLLQEADLEASVYNLIEAANDSGGKDNVTVVLVKIVEQAAPVLQPRKPERAQAPHLRSQNSEDP